MKKGFLGGKGAGPGLYGASGSAEGGAFRGDEVVDTLFDRLVEQADPEYARAVNSYRNPPTQDDSDALLGNLDILAQTMGRGLGESAGLGRGWTTRSASTPPRSRGGARSRAGGGARADAEPAPDAPSFPGGTAGFLEKPDGAGPLYPERPAARGRGRARRAPAAAQPEQPAPTPAGAGGRARALREADRRCPAPSRSRACSRSTARSSACPAVTLECALLAVDAAEATASSPRSRARRASQRDAHAARRVRAALR